MKSNLAFGRCRISIHCATTQHTAALKKYKKNIHRGEGEKIGKIARKEISFMSCEIKFYLATDGIEGEKTIE